MEEMSISTHGPGTERELYVVARWWLRLAFRSVFDLASSIPEWSHPVLYEYLEKSHHFGLESMDTGRYLGEPFKRDNEVRIGIGRQFQDYTRLAEYTYFAVLSLSLHSLQLLHHIFDLPGLRHFHCIMIQTIQAKREVQVKREIQSGEEPSILVVLKDSYLLHSNVSSKHS